MTNCPKCVGSGTGDFGWVGDSRYWICSTCKGTGKVKERVSLFGEVPDKDDNGDE